MPSTFPRRITWLAFFSLLFFSAAIYIPWINNPLIFDDTNILKSTILSDYAITPFNFQPRQFPYFTLGFENIISNGSIKLSRNVAWVLHAINGFLLFTLINKILKKTTTIFKANTIAFCAGLFFVINPVSAYATGYLIQRTIIFATLFLLLAAIQLSKAIEKESKFHAVFAGLCYVMAVMSKEHAIMGFLFPLSLAPIFLSEKETISDKRKIILPYLAISAPIAIYVALLKIGLIGMMYEPDSSRLLDSILTTTSFDWKTSALFQCLFFLWYIFLWVFPSERYLSIDIRPDFTNLASEQLLLPSAIFFSTITIISFFTILKYRSIKNKEILIFPSSLISTQLLFLTELSTIRIQEPIVLYRSYLWAPILIIGAAGLISRTKTIYTIILTTIITISFTPITRNQLEKFSNPLYLWEDAAEKLPRDTVIGSARIFYNRGLQRLKAKDNLKAIDDFNFLTNRFPELYVGHWGLAIALLNQKKYKEAENELHKVIALNPQYGDAWLTLGLLLKKTGNTSESQMALTQAANLGYPFLKDLSTAAQHGDRP